MKDRAVVFFMLVVLIDTIGLGIVIPVMPKLLEHAGGVDAGIALSIGMAIWSVGGFAVGAIVQ